MSATSLILPHRRDHAAAWRVLVGLGPGRIALLGFGAAMGWALAGSLLLGLGRGPASPATAWGWLAGALLIGAVTLAGMLPLGASLDASPGSPGGSDAG